MRKYLALCTAVLLASCSSDSDDKSFSVDGAWRVYSNFYRDQDGTLEETFFQRGIEKSADTIVFQSCQGFRETVYHRDGDNYKDSQGRELIIRSDKEIVLVEGDNQYRLTRDRYIDFNNAGILNFSSTLIQDVDADAGVCVGYQYFSTSPRILLDFSAPFQHGYLTISVNLQNPVYGLVGTITEDDQVHINSDTFAAQYGSELFAVYQGTYTLNIINDTILFDFDFILHGTGSGTEEHITGTAEVAIVSQ